MTAMYNKLIVLLIDKTAKAFLMLMSESNRYDHLQVDFQEMLGKFKAVATDCGCVRPTSCGTCRTVVEDELYWNEKMDDLLQEAINEDLDNEPIN